MPEHSDKKPEWASTREKLMGMGETSLRKSYYPELQQRLRDLQESEERLKTIFNSVNDAIIVQDVQSGTIVNANERASEMFGYIHEEILQGEIGDPTPTEPPFTLGYALQLLREASDGKALTPELQVMHKSGRALWVEANLRRAEFNGKEYILAVVRDVTECHQAAESLSHSERRYRSVVDSIPAGVVVHSNFIVRFANPAAVEAAKVKDPSDMVGRPIWDFIHPDMHETYRMRYEDLLKEGNVQLLLEGKLVNAEGNTIEIEGSALKIPYDGEEAVLSMFRDVTERKRADAALRESEERFRGYFENQIVGMAITSPKKEWLNVNDKLCRMLGYSADELLALTWAEMTYPDDLQPDLDNFDKLLAGEIDGYTMDKRLIRKDGSIIYVMLSVACGRAEDGSVKYVLSLLADVTERKEAEEALKESEERLSLTLEAATEGIYDWNIRTGEVFWSPSWYRSLGYEPFELRPSVDSWAVLVHPDDLPEVQENLNAHLAGKTDAYRQEYRMRNKDGTYRWYIDRGKVVKRDSEGNPLRMVGTDTDITERQEAEEERKAFEAHKRTFYRQTILSVTDGKLEISDSIDMSTYARNAQVVVQVIEKPDVGPARRQVEQMCTEAGLDQRQVDDFILGFGEAVTNAIKHAPQGIVYAGRLEEEVWAAVVDNGPGIESLLLPASILRRGFSTKPSMGLGYSNMLDVSDHIMLETGAGGTTVVLIKRIHPITEPLLILPDTWGGIPTGI